MDNVIISLFEKIIQRTRLCGTVSRWMGWTGWMNGLARWVGGYGCVSEWVGRWAREWVRGCVGGRGTTSRLNRLGDGVYTLCSDSCTLQREISGYNRNEQYQTSRQSSTSTLNRVASGSRYSGLNPHWNRTKHGNDSYIFMFYSQRTSPGVLVPSPGEGLGDWDSL